MSTLQNTIPTTAQMKAALATIQPVKPVRAVGTGMEGVADTIAVAGAGVINGISNAGTGTVSFIDRVATGYKFQRALQTGKLQLATPAVVTKRVPKAK